MYFTKEDILKIQQALAQLGVKDSELQETSLPKWNDYITIVQDGKNKKVSVQKFLNQFVNESFINLTAKYDTAYVSIKEAIKDIPYTQRKKGLLISFIDTNKEWKLYQFKGELSQFNNYTLWDDIFSLEKYIINSLLPDEEDITITDKDFNGNSKLKFKDKKYDPSIFSGMGHKILRKNIVRRVNDDGTIDYINYLSANEFSDSNTIYEIKYDFDLNDKTIQLLENCTLYYNGGSLNNGSIVCNNTILEGTINNNNIQLQGIYTSLDIELNKIKDSIKNVKVNVDEEDITLNNNNELSFKDRSSENGMGYIIIRKDNDLAEQLIFDNTIYEIRYDFDLQENTITLPSNCTLLFKGGSFSNGKLILNNTYILNANKSFSSNLEIIGTVSNNIIDSIWFASNKENNDYYQQFKKIVTLSNNSGKPIIFSKDTYTFINDEKEVIITQSIDFNDSTIILNTNGFENFKLNIVNSNVSIISREDLQSISNAIEDNDFSAAVFKKYKNKLLTINSNEDEILREHNLVSDKLKKKEVLYIDINGFLYNTPFNNTIQGINGIALDCDNQIYIKNLHLKIQDTYTGNQSGAYRYIGLNIYNSSNVQLNNIIIPDPNIENYRLVFINSYNCYNVIYKNCELTNTRNNNNLINNDKSAYVFLGQYIVKLLMDNVNVGNLTSDKVWGATGCNYITDWTIINSRFNRIDVHYRLNNLYIDNSTIGDYGISYTGFGNITIKNSKFTGNSILSPRIDYGNFFDGDIIVENCELLNRTFNSKIFIVYIGVDNFNHYASFSHYQYFGAKNIIVRNLKYSNADSITPIRVYATENLEELITKRIYPNITIDGINDIKLQFDIWKYQSYVFDKDYNATINIKNFNSQTYALYSGFSELYQFDNIATEFPEYQNNKENCYKTILNIYNSTNLVAGLFSNNSTLNIYNSTLLMVSGRFTNSGITIKSSDNQVNVYNSLIVANPNLGTIADIMNQGFYYNCTLSALYTTDETTINSIKSTFYPIKKYANGKHYLNNDARLCSCIMDKVLATYLDIQDYINIGIFDKYNVQEVYVPAGGSSFNPLDYTYYKANVDEIINVNVKEDCIDKDKYRIRLFVQGTINLIFSNEIKTNTCIELMIQSGVTGNSHVYLKDNNGNNIIPDLMSNDLSRYPGTLLYKVIINPQEDGTISLIMNYPSNWMPPRATGSRYNNPVQGILLYDSDLNMPIWWNGNSWINALGNNPDQLQKGTTEQRPTLTTDDEGFQYYDTTLHKPIWWNGTQWIDGTNTPIE